MLSNLARAWSAKIVEPIARILMRLGLTPNAVTVVGFLLTVAVSLVLASGRLVMAGILLIFTLGFDSLDGTLARISGSVSRFGAFLDSTLDRWAEVALYLATSWYMLSIGSNSGAWWSAAAMGSSLLVSYTRARAESVGIPCKEGYFTRFERLLILIAGLIFGFLEWALVIIAVLAGITAIQRIWVTWRADRAGR